MNNAYPNSFNNRRPPFRPGWNYNNRFLGGGFFGPFLLGGITGGLLAPAFYPRPSYNQPFYQPYPPYYYRQF